jgi:hypothetical protein
MASNGKTKIVVGLGLLDIARRVVTAWSAKQQAERERIGFGAGLRSDLVALARDARERAQDRLPDHFEWSLPPWRREPTFADRLRTWGPIGLVVLFASAGVIFAARWVVEHTPDTDEEEAMTDSKVVGAIRAGSEAIDAGVTKTVEGSAGVAVGAASAMAAGSTALKAAVVDRAKDEVDERVVAPAKKKAIKLGVFAILGLTAYVIVIATAVQLIVAALT